MTNAAKERKFGLSHEAVLLGILAFECLYFASIGPRFSTIDNVFDIFRHSVEVGLLALALTPIMLTGGIDLSVGSLLGLCAVVFGKLWRDGGLTPLEAGVCTLMLGTIGGALNATLVAWFRLPSLIVTLATFSLYRGLAESLTRGVDTFTNFPASFLFIGQERWLGVPAQAPLFLAIAIAAWLFVHRTTFGRSFRAIGFSSAAATYAGLPVKTRLASVYVLAGATASLAAILYTARLGQAKADAGTGYEFLAITAVVLGGTSIYGGVGTVHGTILGIAAIGVLENGLVHAHLPREASGMLTGALLILSLSSAAVSRLWSSLRPATARKRTLTQPQ